MWPRAETIRTERLLLEPLGVTHADEMVEVLADPVLYEWTGGEPPTRAVLGSRYAVQSVGESPDRDEGWLNWVLRAAGTGVAVGYVQATLTLDDDAMAADVAWVVGAAHQGHGLAGEAAQAMVSWLEGVGVASVHAFIHPGNVASAALARRLGMSATSTLVDGEVRWTRTSEV